MGVMSGTLDLVQRGYAGTRIRDDVLYFAPRLPERLARLRFAMQFRGTQVHVTFDDGSLTLAADPEGASRTVKVGVGADVRELCPGERCTFVLRDDP